MISYYGLAGTICLIGKISIFGCLACLLMKFGKSTIPGICVRLFVKCIITLGVNWFLF
jgi:hypothetical protein